MSNLINEIKRNYDYYIKENNQNFDKISLINILGKEYFNEIPCLDDIINEDYRYYLSQNDFINWILKIQFYIKSIIYQNYLNGINIDEIDLYKLNILFSDAEMIKFVEKANESEIHKWTLEIFKTLKHN